MVGLAEIKKWGELEHCPGLRTVNRVGRSLEQDMITLKIH